MPGDKCYTQTEYLNLWPWSLRDVIQKQRCYTQNDSESREQKVILPNWKKKIFERCKKFILPRHAYLACICTFCSSHHIKFNLMPSRMINTIIQTHWANHTNCLQDLIAISTTLHIPLFTWQILSVWYSLQCFSTGKFAISSNHVWHFIQINS